MTIAVHRDSAQKQAHTRVGFAPIAVPVMVATICMLAAIIRCADPAAAHSASEVARCAAICGIVTAIGTPVDTDYHSSVIQSSIKTRSTQITKKVVVAELSSSGWQ